MSGEQLTVVSLKDDPAYVRLSDKVDTLSNQVSQLTPLYTQITQSSKRVETALFGGIDERGEIVVGLMPTLNTKIDSVSILAGRALGAAEKSDHKFTLLVRGVWTLVGIGLSSLVPLALQLYQIIHGH